MKPMEILSEQLNNIAEGLVQHTPNFAIAVVLLVITWLVSKIARKAIVKLFPGDAEHRSLRLAIRKLATIGIWLAGIALAAIVLFPSIKPSSMIAGLGLGSVAIGFAFKDIFENFFAGMLILFRQPFRIGDYIEVEDIEGVDGKIEDITIRDTVVRRTDGQPVIVPNSILFSNPVVVRTDRDKRRVSIACGVGYGENVDDARAVIANAVAAVDSVSDDDPVQVFAEGFGASSIDFEVTWWTGSTPLEVRESRDQVVAAIKAALDEAGIEIPFPYRTLTFNESLSVSQAGGAAAND